MVKIRTLAAETPLESGRVILSMSWPALPAGRRDGYGGLLLLPWAAFTNFFLRTRNWWKWARRVMLEHH